MPPKNDLKTFNRSLLLNHLPKSIDLVIQEIILRVVFKGFSLLLSLDHRGDKESCYREIVLDAGARGHLRNREFLRLVCHHHHGLDLVLLVDNIKYVIYVLHERFCLQFVII